MKFKLLIASLLIFLCGCNPKWDCEIPIQPEILGMSGCILSIQYDIGERILLDDLEIKTVARMLYIEKNQKDLKWKVKFHRSSENLSSTITYYINNVSVFSKKYMNKEILDYIESSSKNFPLFVWANDIYKPKNETENTEKNKQLPEEPMEQL